MVNISDKKEIEHFIEVLRSTQKALKNADAFELNRLSDQTIHSASVEQHTDSITIAILLYSLNKILAKKSKINPKKWNSFVLKFNNEIDSSIRELKNTNIEEFIRHIEHAKDLLASETSLKTNVQEVLKKAALNKASRIYEHGISMSQTARLLDITQWELAEYVGQRSIPDNPYNETIEIKKRAKLALNFFS